MDAGARGFVVCVAVGFGFYFDAVYFGDGFYYGDDYVGVWCCCRGCETKWQQSCGEEGV